MKRKHILIAAGGLALLAGLFYFNRAGQTPTGQPPLQNLTRENVAEIARAFNASAGDARVLMLLSPT